jgi:GDP-L-fucose synthase
MAHAQITGPVNIASGHIHAIRDIVDNLNHLTGKVIPIEWDNTKPDGQGKRFYDLSKLRSLGFAPEFDLASGLANTWQWFIANYPNIRS